MLQSRGWTVGRHSFDHFSISDILQFMHAWLSRFIELYNLVATKPIFTEWPSSFKRWQQRNRVLKIYSKHKKRADLTPLLLICLHYLYQKIEANVTTSGTNNSKSSRLCKTQLTLSLTIKNTLCAHCPIRYQLSTTYFYWLITVSLPPCKTKDWVGNTWKREKEH